MWIKVLYFILELRDSDVFYYYYKVYIFDDWEIF